MHLYKKALSFIMALVLTLISVLQGGITVKADERPKTYYSSSVEKSNTGDRSYLLNIKTWSDSGYAGEIESSDTIITVSLTPRILQLADDPSANKSYEVGLAYRSIDENTVFYSYINDAYKPIKLKNNEWYISEKANTSENTIGKVVGKRRYENNEAIDEFYYKMYEKGDCKTHIDYLKEELKAYIIETSDISADSKIGFVFYSDKAYNSDLLALSSENISTLNDYIDTCDKYIESGDEFESALKKAQDLLDSEDENISKNIVTILSTKKETEETENKNENSESEDSNISDTKESEIESSEISEEDSENSERPDNSDISEDNSEIESGDSSEESNTGKDTSVSIVESIVQGGINIYALGIFSESDEQTERYIESIGKDKSEIVSNYQQIGNFLSSLQKEVNSSVSVIIREIIASGFKLSDSQKVKLENAGINYSENSDGTTTVDFETCLPKTQENPCSIKLEIEAKDNFTGGNSILLTTEESGIYRTGYLINAFKPVKVNVPIKTGYQNIEKTIFLGSPLFGTKSSEDIKNEILSTYTPNWYGNSECYVSAYWEDASGNKILSDNALDQILPSVDTDYTLNISYKPLIDGLDAYGEPVDEVNFKVIYSVKLEKGTVKVKMEIPENGEFEDEYVLELERDDGNIVQYKTLNKNDINDDGEGNSIFIEKEFNNLPFGLYTLTKESIYEEGKSVSYNCFIGFEKNSDIVNTKNNYEVIFLDNEENYEKSGIEVNSYTSSFNIDFS